MAVITLGGMSGNGGRTIGPMVAMRLGADYVDRLMLTKVARELGATVEALHQREERPPTTGERLSRILQRILERSAATGAGGDPYFGPGVAAFLTEEYENMPQPLITRGHEVEDEMYIEAVTRVMKEMASSGNVVIVGRGAHVILRDIPGVLSVGLIANHRDRLNTLMDREKLNQAQAEKVLLARDKARAIYFKRYFDINEPDSIGHYDFVINTSEINADYATEMIVLAATALDEGRLSAKSPVAV